MKITKTKHEAMVEETRKKEVKTKCNVCPECGETKDWWSNMVKKSDNEKDIGGVLEVADKYVQVRTGLFRSETRTITCYKCYTCGAEWESDPY